MGILNSLFSTKHQRDIKTFRPLIKRINELEQKAKHYSEADFKNFTQAWKEQIKEGKTTMEKILPEAFALVREASMRTLGMRHYDVQLMGGIVLYQGKIAEMKTGEGKTLSSTLPAYLRALEGRGVNIVTVNDYLSKRDCEWMGPIYEYLGLTVGCIDYHSPHSPGRRESYRCDITYGTNNEFGFDYLRDNMIESMDQRVQWQHHYCIVDEVDSVLIDEARTPLIISGPSESNVEKYHQIDKIIPRLRQAKTDEQRKEIPGTGDYILDEKENNVYVTADGSKKIEDILKLGSLYAQNNVEYLHHVNQALRAHKIMLKDKDYIVENGHVVIVDEFTGRKMEGRRFSDGLHQAIEAKERVNIASENQTLASITFQNYFRMYDAVAGMTGTADTEAEEFKKIYNLEVVVMPPNVPIVRKDYEDKIYRTEKEKIKAIVERVKKAYQGGQPVLLGTITVDKSELLSKALSKAALKHEVLNAKNHAREASIIENAGQRGAITIATNMAGRGTDIKLGPGVKESGGLLIVGSERHEARRVDNQLRGRAGRQGDPGESQFFLSLDDELMRRFGSERISGMMARLGMQDGEEIQHRWITRSIENAQKKVEGRNFEIRKHLLEYDDVMNEQRKYIYEERNYFLEHEDLGSKVMEMIDEVVAEQIYRYAEEREQVSEALYFSVEKWLRGAYHIKFAPSEKEFLSYKYNAMEKKIVDLVQAAYRDKIKDHPQEITHSIERAVFLQAIDSRWKEHLLQMDHLREGITLRSYGERKPLTEFKKEGFRLFEEMVNTYKFEVIETFMKMQIIPQQKMEMHQVFQATDERHDETNTLSSTNDAPAMQNPSRKQIQSDHPIGRNQPCPCGSGKKYKHCHGRV